MAEQSNNLRITNPERVERVIKRLTESNSKVFVRIPSNPKLAIKATIGPKKKIDGVDFLPLTEISAKGRKLLKSESKIKVEFIMMSTKVVFATLIGGIDSECVLIRVPTTLVSVERRKNSRHNTLPDSTAYIQIGRVNYPAPEDSVRPTFPVYEQTRHQLYVGDISMGGLSLVAYFPDVNCLLEQGFIDDTAKLFLPMRAPISIGFEVRWTKKLTEHIHDAANPTLHRAVKAWKFGVEFIDRYYDESARLAVQQYIHGLTQAEAV